MDTPSWHWWEKRQRVLVDYDTLEIIRRKHRNVIVGGETGDPHPVIKPSPGGQGSKDTPGENHRARDGSFHSRGLWAGEAEPQTWHVQGCQALAVPWLVQSPDHPVLAPPDRATDLERPHS